MTTSAPTLILLVIGAHPADIFDQSGGTMAHHARRGDRVACCVLTHGARVHDAVISDSNPKPSIDRRFRRLLTQGRRAKATPRRRG